MKQSLILYLGLPSILFFIFQNVRNLSISNYALTAEKEDRETNVIHDTIFWFLFDRDHFFDVL
jgi:hypothetical protein